MVVIVIFSTMAATANGHWECGLALANSIANTFEEYNKACESEWSDNFRLGRSSIDELIHRRLGAR